MIIVGLPTQAQIKEALLVFLASSLGPTKQALRWLPSYLHFQVLSQTNTWAQPLHPPGTHYPLRFFRLKLTPTSRKEGAQAPCTEKKQGEMETPKCLDMSCQYVAWLACCCLGGDCIASGLVWVVLAPKSLFLNCIDKWMPWDILCYQI